MTGFRFVIMTSAAVLLIAPEVLAQGVAFQPVVSSLANGPTLSATPVVSADRRYVRMSLNAQFIGNAGFNTYIVPGAVTGGPSGPGALGGVGLGGAGGGLGGMGGGAGGAAGGAGGQFLAGMDGVIDPTMAFGPGAMPPAFGFVNGPEFSGNAFAGPGMMAGGPQFPRAGAAQAGVRPVIRKRAQKPRAKGTPPHSASSAAPVTPPAGGRGR